jgi:predicted MFS family arabinose efflux permease
VLGVPLGLESARLLGFRTPFFGVGALTLVAASVAAWVLPPLRDHLSAERREASSNASIVEPTILLSLACSAILMLGNFSLVPNLSAYLQANLHFPREKLGVVYAVGGASTFVAMRVTGYLVDRIGAATMLLIGAIAYGAVLVGIFLVPVLTVAPVLGFACFMTSNSLRAVPLQSLSSRVPTRDRRARFLSAQSAVQHMGSSLGAMGASAFLTSTPDGRLVGLERIAAFVLGLSLLVPVLGFAIERRVRAREADEARSPLA